MNIKFTKKTLLVLSLIILGTNCGSNPFLIEQSNGTQENLTFEQTSAEEIIQTGDISIVASTDSNSNGNPTLN